MGKLQLRNKKTIYNNQPRPKFGRAVKRPDEDEDRSPWEREEELKEDASEDQMASRKVAPLRARRASPNPRFGPTPSNAVNQIAMPWDAAATPSAPAVNGVNGPTTTAFTFGNQPQSNQPQAQDQQPSQPQAAFTFVNPPPPAQSQAKGPVQPPQVEGQPRAQPPIAFTFGTQPQPTQSQAQTPQQQPQAQNQQQPQQQSAFGAGVTTPQKQAQTEGQQQQQQQSGYSIALGILGQSPSPVPAQKQNEQPQQNQQQNQNNMPQQPSGFSNIFQNHSSQQSQSFPAPSFGGNNIFGSSNAQQSFPPTTFGSFSSFGQANGANSGSGFGQNQSGFGQNQPGSSGFGQNQSAGNGFGFSVSSNQQTPFTTTSNSHNIFAQQAGQTQSGMSGGFFPQPTPTSGPLFGGVQNQNQAPQQEQQVDSDMEANDANEANEANKDTNDTEMTASPPSSPSKLPAAFGGNQTSIFGVMNSASQPNQPFQVTGGNMFEQQLQKPVATQSQSSAFGQAFPAPQQNPTPFSFGQMTPQTSQPQQQTPLFSPFGLKSQDASQPPQQNPPAFSFGQNTPQASQPQQEMSEPQQQSSQPQQEMSQPQQQSSQPQQQSPQPLQQASSMPAFSPVLSATQPNQATSAPQTQSSGDATPKPSRANLKFNLFNNSFKPGPQNSTQPSAPASEPDTPPTGNLFSPKFDAPAQANAPQASTSDDQPPNPPSANNATSSGLFGFNKPSAGPSTDSPAGFRPFGSGPAQTPKASETNPSHSTFPGPSGQAASSSTSASGAARVSSLSSDQKPVYDAQHRLRSLNNGIIKTITSTADTVNMKDFMYAYISEADKIENDYAGNRKRAAPEESQQRSPKKSRVENSHTTPAQTPSRSQTSNLFQSILSKDGEASASPSTATPTPSNLFSSSAKTAGTSSASNLFDSRPSDQTGSSATSTSPSKAAPEASPRKSPQKPTQTPKTASATFGFDQLAPKNSAGAKSSSTPSAPPAFQIPKFGNGGAPTNFMAQFGEKAAKTQAAEKAKRKAEDFDSDEDDEAEWEKKDAENQAKKRAKLQAEGGNKIARWTPDGFVLEDSPDPSSSAGESDAEKTAIASKRTVSGVTSAPKDQAATSSSVFSPANFERNKALAGSNIFAHLSDVGSNASGDDAGDEDSNDTDEDDESEEGLQSAAQGGDDEESGEGEEDGESEGTDESNGSEQSLSVVKTRSVPSQSEGEPSYGADASESEDVRETSDPNTDSNPESHPSKTPHENIGKSLFERITTPDQSGNNANARSNFFASTSSSANSATGGYSFFGNTSKTPPPGDYTFKNDSPPQFSSVKPAFNFHAPSPPPQLDGASDSSTTPASRPFSNLFGSAKPNASPSLFAQTPPTSGGTPGKLNAINFNFGGPPKDSLLAPPSTGPGSVVDSRASTPGLITTDAESGAEGPAEDDAQPAMDQVNLTAVAENEEILYEAEKARGLLYDPTNKEKAWNPKGTGTLRVLKNKEDGVVSLLLRMAPSGNIVFNSRILKGAAYKHAGKKSATFPVPKPDGSLQTWCVQFANENLAKQFVETCDANKGGS